MQKKTKKNYTIMLELLDSIQNITNKVICVENGRRTGKTTSLILLCGKILNSDQIFVFLSENDKQRGDCEHIFESLFKNQHNAHQRFKCLFLTKADFSQFTAPDNGFFDYLIIDDYDSSTFKIPENNEYKKVIISRVAPDFKVSGLDFK
jgi:hypothetical protein